METRTSKIGKAVKRACVSVATFGSVFATSMVEAFAFGDTVTITNNTNVDANDLMGKIIGILLTITRYVGVALLIYGVYEIVMSFMQNQPEAKTKGIIMALAGVVMIGLKSIIQGLGVI